MASPPGQRSPAEIRESIEDNRAQLAVSVQKLRTEVHSLTDWRGHLKRHRSEVLVGAAVAGFVIGGGIAALTSIRRRRRG